MRKQFERRNSGAIRFLSVSAKPDSEAYFDEGTIGFDGELFTILQVEFDKYSLNKRQKTKANYQKSASANYAIAYA